MNPATRTLPLLTLLAGCTTQTLPLFDATVADASDARADLDAADDAGAPTDAPLAGDAARPPRLFHQSEATTLAPGEERATVCESWTLDNDETVYVNAVTFQATAGMHHSNWLYVPLSYYQGPDGTWDCSTRAFDEGVAAAAGGVLFAQSTQSVGQVQQFAPGVAIPVPPHARVVGQVHLLNATAQPVNVQYSVGITAIPPGEVQTRLSALYLEYGPLNIAPRARSRFNTACDIDTEHQRILGRPLDFKLYYGLPHYHALGTAMRVSVIGGPNDGMTVFSSTAQLGDPGGQTMEPPIDLTGATGLALSCDFDNPRDVPVGYGVGDQEMCIFLGFTDSTYEWAGRAPIGGPATPTGTDPDGTVENSAACTDVYGLLNRGYTR